MENNNKLALQEIRWKVREWVNLTEERDKWLTAVNAQVPSTKCSEFLDYKRNY
jgi:hypothetical protein